MANDPKVSDETARELAVLGNEVASICIDDDLEDGAYTDEVEEAVTVFFDAFVAAGFDPAPSSILTETNPHISRNELIQRRVSDAMCRMRRVRGEWF
jgi:hypothetical protein